MILPYTNNAAPPSSSNLASPAVSLSNTNTSSVELAKVSSYSSVNVQLSSSQGALAAAVATIPPIYNKPKVNALNELQVSPSRASASPGALADNAILEKASNSGRSDKETGKSNALDKISSSEPSNESVTVLSEEELKMVEELKIRDREVKAHEQAHKSVGGQYTGAISFNYQSGPDGKRYAVGGEVPIDVSPIPGDPQATISKMQVVRAAATAPAEPSSQDLLVAAQAARLLAEAQSELSEQKMSEFNDRDKDEETEDKLGSSSDETKIDTSIATFQSVANVDQLEENLIDTTA